LFGYLECECCDGLLKVIPTAPRPIRPEKAKIFKSLARSRQVISRNAPDKCSRSTLKALANNKYVAQRNGGASPLIANRDNRRPVGLFIFIRQQIAELNIKSAINGKYVIASETAVAAR
jgi:hypothetical protein